MSSDAPRLSRAAAQIVRCLQMFDLGLLKPSPADKALGDKILAKMDAQEAAVETAKQRLTEIARAAAADVRNARRDRR